MAEDLASVTGTPRNGGPADIDRLLAELLAAWNGREVERAAMCFAPRYVGIDVGEAGSQRGRQGVRSTMGRYLQAFPDLRFHLAGRVVQSDRAILSWIAEGTHRGPWLRIPATGRRVTVRGMSWLTVEDQAITQGLHVWDTAGLLRALGLLPEL